MSGNPDAHPEASLPFMPAWLDDSGLHYITTRVYLTLCRRSGKDRTCWPSVRTIGKNCGCDTDTVGKHLNILECLGMIRRARKTGGVNTYTLADPAEFLSRLPTRNDGAPRKTRLPETTAHLPETTGHPVPRAFRHPLPETTGYKGTPIRKSNEGDPKKEKAEASPPLVFGPKMVTIKAEDRALAALAEVDGRNPANPVPTSADERYRRIRIKLRTRERSGERMTEDRLAEEVRTRAGRFRERFSDRVLSATYLERSWEECA